ncbi:pumilio homolog 24 isoform X2 [Dendrobium catenatum]|uniref:Pumilio like 24 n=1 Tax=Dendrobium catenatum TaxID=906689 RepID=A0A2I0VNF7_9ASPA|nr:pumilio homolog 24 isoform X2 [Dendrobium catenatum]PKU64948.1 Pumilio like 24 [Dendrobium catenatum]
MAAVGKLGDSKKRVRESSAAKGGAKRRVSDQTKLTERKHFKKKVKARPLKTNQSVKHGSALGEIMDSAGDLGSSKKRKRGTATAKEGEKPRFLKQSKSAGAIPFNKIVRAKHLKPTEKDVAVPEKKEDNTPKERRLAAKEKAEARKIRRKPNYILEKELASLWEKMRCYSIGKVERSKLVSEALQKMYGKLLEVASSHVSARVLQTCIKYGSQEERNVVFEELRPHLLTLSRKKYAVHLVKKLLDVANKKQLEGFISSLHGHVSFLIRHTVGSAVVEHAYHLASGSQRQRLLMEMYSTELQLFKDLTLTNAGSLADLISKLKLQKSSVLQHMTSIIQPLLEKGIVDYSIIHATLVEYFTIADRSSAADVIQQLLPLLSQESVTDDGLHASSKRKNKRRKTRIPLVNMMHTRDGLKVGIFCIKHGTAKDRKKIVKGIKDHIRKLALDQYGSLLLSSILSVVDDTKLVTKIIIRELQSMLKELVLDKNGRRPLLLLLHPQCHRYFTPDDLACLNSTVPSLCTQDEKEEGASEAGLEKILEIDTEAITTQNNKYNDSLKTMQSAVGGKKEALVRRKELLVESGLAECLIETCIDTADELLRSNFGREVIFEVAVGGSDGILHSLSDRLADLHKAIATVAAFPKSEESEADHIFENFHSSRTIRKLILDSPSFAETLWKMALEGKSAKWAKGHSCKVVSAFLESSEISVRDLTKPELQPLVDSGIIKLSDRK